MAIIINGNTPLHGTVSISGSKNSAVKLVFASMFSSEDVILNNVPKAEALLYDLEIIRSVGGKADWIGANKLLLNGANINSFDIPHEIGSKYRTAFLFAGPLLFRFGRANIPKFTPQLFKASPLNRIIDTWGRLGVKVEEDEKYYRLTLSDKRQSDISFRVPTHTGTDNAILSALFVDGETIINNASEEFEIDDLIEFCTQIGGDVARIEPKKIKVTGVRSFRGTEFSVQSDKTEAAIFCAATVISRGSTVLKNVNKPAIVPFLSFLSKVGINFEFVGEELRLWSTERQFNPADITISPSPGFVPDWQALAVLILSKASGTSLVHDTVYYDRFGYIQDLNRMGADIELVRPSDVGLSPVVSDDSFDFKKSGEPHTVAKIKGPVDYLAQKLYITDPRAANALVLAALAAKGHTEISNYASFYEPNEGFFDKLINLGAKISRT